jgi:hypothetical protein
MGMKHWANFFKMLLVMVPAPQANPYKRRDGMTKAEMYLRQEL